SALGVRPAPYGHAPPCSRDGKPALKCPSGCPATPKRKARAGARIPGSPLLCASGSPDIRRGKAAQARTRPVANRLHRLFDQYARPRLLAALHALAGQPPGILVDEARYREQVLDAAWRDLPLPLRMLGRKRPPWDDLLLALRPQVFDAQGGKLSVRPDASARLDALVRQLFGAADAPAPPTPTTAPVAPRVKTPTKPSSATTAP